MKKNKFPTIGLFSFLIFFAALELLGFDPAAIIGLFIIIFFGIGSFIAGILSIFKFGYEKNLLVLIASILFILTSPLTIWFGYTIFASGVYLSFLSDPTKVIYNPTSSLALPLMSILAGLTGIFIVFIDKTKKKSDNWFKIILVLSGILFILLGGRGTYLEIYNSEQSAAAVVTYKTLSGTRYTAYKLTLDINGDKKDFRVSRQIYSIFNIGDRVSVTYNDNSLKTITLGK